MFCCLCLDLAGAPVEDRSSPTSAAPVTETGPLLPVQRCGPDPAHVCVCSAGSLDGLCLVRHRTQGDRKQWPRNLGHRWAPLNQEYNVHPHSLGRPETFFRVSHGDPKGPGPQVMLECLNPSAFFQPLAFLLSVQRKSRSQRNSIISPVMNQSVYIISPITHYITCQRRKGLPLRRTQGKK